MRSAFKNSHRVIVVMLCLCMVIRTNAQSNASSFKVIAFYTAKRDTAHISFVHEANRWFQKIAKDYNFTYDSTNDWSKLNTSFLSQYKVVLFLDTRPEDPVQRAAFETYMKNGGAWMG